MPPKRHLKLENVLLQAIALECGALRLIRELFVMMPVVSVMYETQSQFGKGEDGRLNESLLYECANFPGNLFTKMTSHVGVVTPTIDYRPTEKPSGLSPLKI